MHCWNAVGRGLAPRCRAGGDRQGGGRGAREVGRPERVDRGREGRKASGATADIAKKIAGTLFSTADGATDAALEQAKRIFEALQQGRVDRALFTSNLNAYFDEQALKDYAASLGPLGKPEELTQLGQSLRGGMTLRRFNVKFAKKSLHITSFTMPDGKLEQFLVAAAE